MAETVQPDSDDSGGRLESLPVKHGAMAGAAASIVGVLVTYVLSLVDSDLNDGLDDIVTAFDELGAGVLDGVIWIFLQGHLVDVEVSREFGDETETETIDLFAEYSTSLPELLYTAVPAVILIGAGYLVAQRVETPESEEALKAGASVVVGYLPAVVVLRFVSRLSESDGEQSFAVAPELANTLIVAGLLFPVILGAIGGYIAFSRS